VTGLRNLDASPGQRRDDHPLVAAIDAGDHIAVRRIWGGFWGALATGWQPKQTRTLKELRVYAERPELRNEDPAVLEQAVLEWDGSYVPLPAEVLAGVRRIRGETGRVDTGRCRNPVMEPAALEATARRLAAGELLCSCDVRQPTWRLDSSGVLRCPTCKGLEHGQVYAAEDAGLISEAA
jgi:hypothetical protein